MIAGYVTGKRDYASSNILISDLRTRVADRFQITSDGWQGFIRGVLDNNQGDKMDYAFQVKKFDNYSFIPESDKRR